MVRCVIRACLLTIMLVCETAGIRVAKAADPAETARIAALADPDRAAVLEKGARNEGELLIYTVGAQIDPLLAKFREKFPFLTVRTYKGDTVAITRRVFEEYKAGVYDVDAYELNDYGLLPIGEAGYLAPLGSPELAQYRPGAIEPHKRWVVMREDQISLGFNHAIINPSAAPASNAELLDPKWKGKLGMYGESTAIAHAVGTILLSEGEDFLRKLAAQQPTVYNMGGRAVANLIVSGEAPIVINARKSHMFSSAREGAPVSWRAIGPVYAAVSAAAIASRARHPYAAALFVDFMLSEEAQRIYRDDLGYTSLRKDMTAADEPRQKLFLGSRPDFETEYETWSRLAARLFKGRR